MDDRRENIQDRLQDVYAMGILDTPAEKELDDITELASVICGTPISLITILDDKRQWFKSKKGILMSETKLEDSFCQHALHKPNETLVVNDALEDERFFQNKHVLNDPHMRFYAGVPLVTKSNNVLGTLCVIDRKPRILNKQQEKALNILAQKAMNIIEMNKRLNELSSAVKLTSERLIKITENIPLGLFELEIKHPDKFRFTFISKGMHKINPELNWGKWIDSNDFNLENVHREDFMSLKNALLSSIKNGSRIYHEYRVMTESGYDWHAIDGMPKTDENGKTVIYGAFSDITARMEYRTSIEQMAFDISHVLRRPVTTILGLSNLIESEQEISHENLKKYTGYIKTVANELEEYTRNLNQVYAEKKTRLTSQSPT